MPQLDAPIPIGAIDTFGTIFITFNHPILNLPMTPAPWFVRSGNVIRTVNTVSQFAIREVRLLTTPGAADPGPDIVSYTPPPADVISDTARQIAAPPFLAFPIT